MQSITRSRLHRATALGPKTTCAEPAMQLRSTAPTYSHSAAVPPPISPPEAADRRERARSTVLSAGRSQPCFGLAQPRDENHAGHATSPPTSNKECRIYVWVRRVYPAEHLRRWPAGAELRLWLLTRHQGVGLRVDHGVVFQLGSVTSDSLPQCRWPLGRPS